MGHRPPPICCSGEAYQIGILEDKLEWTVAALERKHNALDRERGYLDVESHMLRLVEEKIADAEKKIADAAQKIKLLDERILELSSNAYTFSTDEESSSDHTDHISCEDWHHGTCRRAYRTTSCQVTLWEMAQCLLFGVFRSRLCWSQISIANHQENNPY